MSTGANAQAPSSPKSYTCYRAGKNIAIDGRLNEKAWKQAAWTDAFVDIEGDKKPLPLQETRVKMLWDNQYLYIAAQIEEEHIWAYQDQKDQIVYLENDFEVFIDPDGDTENYYELEINAINNTFDLFLPKTYRKGGRAQLKWDIKGLKSAVSVDGTVNDAKDKDKRWIVEIAIPFASLATEDVQPVMPADGSEWRINFSRVNWQHEVGQDGRYSRKRNTKTGKIIPEYNWVWSPQGIINMHYPEYWGKLLFRDESAGKAR
ncbi:carbohydrate-binding family 9-like protein [Dyadobacter sp. 50-39]|uniref:carbohydrate-binding family 9-like protein n=1 Tax=Dyadobacter sp. 50-39 TaxID=1895756 RepID=UPI0025BD99EE|nr:carbohydrate-binding family 9-like protein [Dyadobacter sp. 50-39]